MARVLCIGNVTIDLIIVPKAHTLKTAVKDLIIPRGVKVDTDTLKFCVGGSASNIAHSLKNAGHAVTVFSQIGNDYYGQIISKTLATKKIKAKFCKTLQTPTIVSMVMLYEADRTIFTSNVECDYNEWADFNFDDFDWIVLGPIHKTATKLYQKIQDTVINTKCRLAFIPSAFQIKNDSLALRQILRIADLYISNLEEASALTHNVAGSDQKRIASTISQYGPQIVAITDGKNGAIVYAEDKLIEKPAYTNPNIVDTTGAGDAFAGAMIATIANSTIWDVGILTNALEVGLHNSSAILSEYGANHGILTQTEFRKAWKKRA